MKKRIFKNLLITLMTVAMVFANFGTISVDASEEDSNESNTGMNDLEMVYVQEPWEEMDENTISIQNYNVMERSFDGTIEMSGIASYSNDDEIQNTDPDHAYLLTNNSVYQSAIETEGEWRWYGVILNETSTLTMYMQMTETLDADIYIFSFDQQTGEFELVGGSVNEGCGVSEKAKYVFDSGIYFFVIAGYEGTGNYGLAYYQSTYDANYEVNDSMETATTVPLNTAISGIIDSEIDCDFYCITIDEPIALRYSIDSYDCYDLLFAAATGEGAALYSPDKNSDMVKAMPGTYYFVVLSHDGYHSDTSTYTIRFDKVADAVSSNNVSVVGYCQEAGIVLEANSNGSECYINGNPIDISYSYYHTSSNDYGSQLYDIAVVPNRMVYAWFGDDQYRPDVVYYSYSTKPAMKVSARPALMLTFISESDFYRVHCRCTGYYSSNNYWQDYNWVTAIIDPETGKLIDIYRFNYYYDYAPVGTNYITISYPYIFNVIRKGDES